MNEGWIKLHRRLLEWEWYNDINVMRVFTHLLLKANHKPKKYRGTTVDAGHLLTGRDLLAHETGLTVQQIRTALNKLKSTNDITIKTNKQGSNIQIVNYKKYQAVTNKATLKQPDSNQIVTTNKNVKNEISKEYKGFSFFDNEFLIVWKEYLSMRKEIKKPATGRAEILALNKVNEYSKGDKMDAIKIVNNSIMNSWQGIFDIKKEKSNKPQMVL